MVNPVVDINDHLKEIDVEIRALKKRMEAVTAGDTIRADTISGVIPAANMPVYWWYNGNLLGGGVKADLRQHARVWISGTFVAGRAYYDIGTYADPWLSGVDWNANDSFVGWGQAVDFDSDGYVWISGSFLGGEAVITVGLYPLPFISGVSFALHGDPLCYGAGLDFEEGTGIWVSGTCVDGQATFKIGAYPGGGGGSGTVAFYVDDFLFCDALEAELSAGAGIWISGVCEAGGTHAKFEIGAYAAAGGGDDILALTYAVAF